MTDTITVWQLRDDMAEVDRINVEGVLRSAGGKEITLRKVDVVQAIWQPQNQYVWVEVDEA